MNNFAESEILRDPANDLTAKVYLKEYSNPYMLTPHLHTEYEIYYHIGGGKGFFIDDAYYSCEPHDLFIIRRMRVHRITVKDPENYLRCVINIGAPLIERICSLTDDPTNLDFLDKAGDTLPIKVNLGRENHEKLLMHIKEYLRLEQANDSLMLTAKLLEILAFIKFIFTENESTTVEEASPETWSEKAVYFIERNFKTCQAADVAKALSINENYLSRIFKSETGTQLNTYIIEHKIAEAKRLLYNGESVKNACAMSGFNDCSNFIRTFKKFTGASPGHVKKLYK